MKSITLLFVAMVCLGTVVNPAQAQADKPNILVI